MEGGEEGGERRREKRWGRRGGEEVLVSELWTTGCDSCCVCVFVAISGEFAKYMTTFKPFLILALKNFAEHQVQLGGVHCAIRHYFTTPPSPSGVPSSSGTGGGPV